MALINPEHTPTIDEFRPAVLEVLSDGQTRAFRQLCEDVANHMQLSPEVRAETVPSGQPRYINRTNWACSSFAQAELVTRPKRGHYMITDNGRLVAQRGLTTYSERDMLEWPAWQAYRDEVAARKGNPADRSPQDHSADLDSDADPLESMEVAQASFNAKTETELRRRLQAASPDFFEKAVLDVLWAMGYGGDQGERHHVGKSGDGGIDGIISQDKLGLTNIYVQAKRYDDANTVGSVDLRNFIGALDSRGATLGVFITTSTFTQGARTTAAGYRHGRIVLIDGIRLTRLMLAYGVAVHKAREFVIYEIDDDFFDDELA